MLNRRWDEKALRRAILPRGEWKPFPAAAERGPWRRATRASGRQLVRRAEKAHGFAWPPLPASLYLDFARTGNRDNYQRPYFLRRRVLCDLVLGECAEYRGRFLADIIDGAWLLCEESGWVIPAHCGLQRAGRGLPDTAEPTVDLFAAETAALLAWTLHLLGDELAAVSPLVGPRLAREIRRRVLEPLLAREDFGWMGFRTKRARNWNPWIVSNWLACALILEENQERRAGHILKAMRVLDNYLDPHPADGGCDEGPGYWSHAGGSLFECLEWLRTSTGGLVDIYDEPVVAEIARFICRAQVAGEWFINFSDAHPRLVPPPGPCLGFGLRLGDPGLLALGAWAAARPPRDQRGSIARELFGLFLEKPPRDEVSGPPLPRDVFLPETGLAAARERAGKSRGFFLAFKGGHNGEGHNHNDVGQFIVYLDGRPVIVDPGACTYTANTFGAARYGIWTMQSAFHNLPLINGFQQAAGEEFAARGIFHRAGEKEAVFGADIARAWPAEAGVISWERTLVLERGRSVTLADRYRLKGRPSSLALHLVTACRPEEAGPGLLDLGKAPLARGRVSGEARLEFDPERFRVGIEKIALDEPTPENPAVEKNWGKRLYRLVFSAGKPAATGEWKIRITRAGAAGRGKPGTVGVRCRKRA